MLRRKCEPIAPDYPDVKKLAEDMFLTLEEAEGVGLAAPQIGKDIRLFIVDCTPWAEEDPSCADYKRAFVNPEIYEFSEEKKTYNEGCLSFPGIHADVARSLSIRMRYMDTDFVEHDEEFTGLKAPARPRWAGECRICAPSRSRYSCRRAGASSGMAITMGCPAVRLARVSAAAKAPVEASMMGWLGASACCSAARASIPSARASRDVPVGPSKSR